VGRRVPVARIPTYSRRSMFYGRRTDRSRCLPAGPGGAGVRAVASPFTTNPLALLAVEAGPGAGPAGRHNIRATGALVPIIHRFSFLESLTCHQNVCSRKVL